MVNTALSYREKLKKLDLFGPPESGVRGNLISFYECAMEQSSKLKAAILKQRNEYKLMINKFRLERSFKTLGQSVFSLE